MSFRKYLAGGLLGSFTTKAALAAAGTSSVQSFFSTIETAMSTISLTVVTIAVMWAGFKVLFQGNSLQEVAKPLLGGIMIGAAGWIASLFVG